MVDLAVGHLGILFRGVQVQARSSIVVVSEDDLFSRLVLGTDVVEGEGIGAVFTPPGEGGLEAFERLGDVPFCGAEVAEEALAG